VRNPRYDRPGGGTTNAADYRRAPSIDITDRADMVPRMTIRDEIDARIIVRALVAEWRVQIAGRTGSTTDYRHGDVFDLLIATSVEALRAGIDVTRYLPTEIANSVFAVIDYLDEED